MNKEEGDVNNIRKNKKSVPLLQKSLSVVLHSLQGESVTVELKSDELVTGVIETANHNMDMKLCNIKNNEDDFLDIYGENVRYVHIPPHINIMTHLRSYMRNQEQQMWKKRKIVDRPKKLQSNETNNSISITSSTITSCDNTDDVNNDDSESDSK